MKKFPILLTILLSVTACRAPGSPIPVTRLRVTPTAVSPTSAANVVEVTRVVVEVPQEVTAEPTATPAPCTPLFEDMRLTISMAEQEHTIELDVEGLLPEDKPIVLLNGRSPNHSSAIELTLANPLGPGGRYQDTFHLGESDIVNWSGQIIHQRGALCFEFTFPLTEPVVLEGSAPTPRPTTTPLPLPTPTITPIPDTLAQTEVDFVSDCIVWLDYFDNETGFIVELGYPRSGDWFRYHTPANVTAIHVPPEDSPRLMESDEQCLNRQSIAVWVTAVPPP